MARALITGITGQDGWYLSNFLTQRGYDVHGVVRRVSNVQQERLQQLRDVATLHPGDMLDSAALLRIVELVQPDEVYNLAAQSSVGDSWHQAELTSNINYLGTLRLLEACRAAKPDVRFYQASTSELFGNAAAPQNEDTVFQPCSPYAVSKLAAHFLVQNYRKSYGMFACCGILFNHESPFRTIEFVTRKITNTLAKIADGQAASLLLGNTAAVRDWGFAGDYVKAMWMMLQHGEPLDFVVATGESRTVEQFLQLACDHFGIRRDDPRIGTDHKLFRPVDVNELRGDASRIQRVLGWEPTVTFHGLVEMMCNAEGRTNERQENRGVHAT